MLIQYSSSHCPCSQSQPMNHIVQSYPLIKSLLQLHPAKRHGVERLSHTRRMSRKALSWSRSLGSQRRRWLSHTPGGRLPLLSARPAVTFPVAGIIALLPIPTYTAWWQRHTGVRRATVKQCPGRTPTRELMNRKYDALPIAPPCHHEVGDGDESICEKITRVTFSGCFFGCRLSLWCSLLHLFGNAVSISVAKRDFSC